MLLVLRALSPDAWLLFATRFTRLFAYGALSVVLVFYLVGIGLSEPQTGMLLTLILVGDTIVTEWADWLGDRMTASGAIPRPVVERFEHLIDDARKLRNIGKPAWQGLIGKHGAPFGEAPVPECGIEEDPARSEKSP